MSRRSRLPATIYTAAVMLAAAGACAIIWAWPPTYGIDLGGGLNLVYQVDRGPASSSATRLQAFSELDRAALIRALRQRLDPGRTREIDIRSDGPWQVEVSLPQVGSAELDRLQQTVSATGVLEFHIVAHRDDPRHEKVIRLANEQAEDAAGSRMREVVDDGQVLGKWITCNRPPLSRNNPDAVDDALGILPPGAVLRDGDTGQLIDLPETLDTRNPRAVEEHLRQSGVRQVELLVVVDAKHNLTGADIATASAGVDEHLAPCLDLRATPSGGRKLAALTSEHLPHEESDTFSYLAMVFDDQLVSASRIMSQISDTCRITGDFTRAQVDLLVDVLRAGQLPVALEKTPVVGTIPPSQPAQDAVRFTLLGVLALLVVWWFYLALRCRPLGTDAALTSLLQAVGIVATVVLLDVTVTPVLVFSTTAMLLITLMGLYWVVAPLKGNQLGGDPLDRRITPTLRRRAVPLTVLLGVLGGAGFLAQAVGNFTVRCVATPLLLGSIIALPAFAVCVILTALVPGTEGEGNGLTDGVGDTA